MRCSLGRSRWGQQENKLMPFETQRFFSFIYSELLVLVGAPCHLSACLDEQYTQKEQFEQDGLHWIKTTEH